MIIGVIVELFVLIPSLLFLQAFRFVQSSSSKLLHIVLYIITYLMMLTSIFFIIARGLEFGDEKSRQWLISILTGFVSSIFLTQPLKVMVILFNSSAFCSDHLFHHRSSVYLCLLLVSVISRTKINKSKTI